MTLNRSVRDLCAHVYEDDGRSPRLDKKTRTNRDSSTDRKTLQLCKQAKIAIGYLLHTMVSDPVLGRLDVARVEPHPDATRLLVVCEPTEIVRPEFLSVAEARLRSQRSAMRMAVGEATTRKRVPELVFAVCPREVIDE